jgi:hypothetical protein
MRRIEFTVVLLHYAKTHVVALLRQQPRMYIRSQGTLAPGTLLLWNSLGAAVLLMSTAVFRPKLEAEVFGRAVRRALLLLAGTYLLSPLLQVSAACSVLSCMYACRCLVMFRCALGTAT